MSIITGLSDLPATGALNAHNTHVDSAGISLAQLSTGTRLTKASIDSSTSAIVNTLNSNLKVYQQAETNARNGSAVIQVAIGALQNNINVISQLKALSSQAAGGGLSSTGLAQIDKQFQQLLQQVDSNAQRATWNGTSLLLGGGGAVTAAGPIAANSTVVASAPALAAGIVSGQSVGFISGTAKSITVTSNVATPANYDYNLTIADPNGGQQTFRALNQAAPANAGTLTLFSTSDSANSITFTWGATAPATPAAAQTALTAGLGLGPGAAPASFASGSIALGTTTVAVGTATPAGTYAISSAANSGVLKLSLGQVTYTQPVVNSPAAAQSVTFGNGITVTLAAGFTTAAGIGQSVFTVGTASSASMNFQLDLLSTDIQKVDFSSSSTTALGLSGLNVTSVGNAQSAQANLDAALQQLNLSYSQLGASLKRLEVTVSNLQTTIENNKAAAGVYGDADLTAALTDFVKSNTMQQVSFTAISKSLQMQEDLAGFIRNT